MSYLEFALQPRPRTRRTDVWRVVSTSSGERLGEIRWYARWRQYCFFPAIGTIFNRTCLEEIADFARDRTADQRRGARKAA